MSAFGLEIASDAQGQIRAVRYPITPGGARSTLSHCIFPHTHSCSPGKGYRSRCRGWGEECPGNHLRTGFGLPGLRVILGVLAGCCSHPWPGCMTSAAHYPEVATLQARGDLRRPSGNRSGCVRLAAASAFGRRLVLQCQGRFLGGGRSQHGYAPTAGDCRPHFPLANLPGMGDKHQHERRTSARHIWRALALFRACR